MTQSSRPRILKPDETYTFRRYFEMKFAIADILQELDATFTKGNLTLPQATRPALQESLPALEARLSRAIARVNLTSESARQQTLIAPILLEVAELTNAMVNIEYSIEVNQYLRGDLDYYLRTDHQVLVIEAKQADITRGFTQLAVELIALDGWTTLSDPKLYGAVTTGDIWQFGCFDRATRRVTQDLTLYRVPLDLALLMPILIGILS